MRKLALLLQLLFIPALVFAQNGSLQEFTVNPSAATSDTRDFSVDMAAAPDGSLWIAGYQNRLYHVALTGNVTTYQLPWLSQVTSSLVRIAAATDGAVWHISWTGTETFISRLAPNGTLNQFLAPNGASSLAAGASGTAWITESNGIAKVSPGGSISRLPTAFSGASNIIIGADGALWYSGCGVIGRTTLDGATESFPVENPCSWSYQLASAGSKIWFLNPTEFGYLTTDGTGA